MSQHWAQTTFSQYHMKLSIFKCFQSSFCVPPLHITSLHWPPSSPSIPIMWAQQYFTLVVVKLQAHGLRSAVSHYLAWDLQVSDPQAAFDALNHPSAELGAICP
jgi:hypothetical protein